MKKLKDILKESNVQIGKVYSNPYATAFVKENEEQKEPQMELSEEQKKAFLEAVKQYKKYGEAVYRNAGLGEVYESIKNMVEMAGKVTLSETDDWFDNVTVSRHMKRMGESFKVFEKTLKEVSTLQQRLEASYDEIGEVLGKYYEISEELDPVGKEDGDIDNDGDEDASDEYLANRRKVISKAIKNESMKLTDMISVNEAKNLKKAKQALIDFNSGKLGEDEMVKTVIKSLGFKFDDYSEEEAGIVLGSLIKKGKIPTDNYVLNNVIDVLEESVNEASEEFVVYVEKDNGRKKLLHTKKSQRAANMFLTKNADKILNQSGIRTIGSMSKFHWEKDEAQYAENIKKTDMKTVTKKEWDAKHNDYKGMIKGKPYMMWFDKKTQSTVYGPVNIKESVVNEDVWTSAQKKQVEKLDDEFRNLLAKKGIDPYSYTASKMWKSAGFQKKFQQIFQKDESVNEAKYLDKLSGKELAKRMHKNKLFKPFATKFAKMKTVTHDYVQNTLPEWMPGTEIRMLFSESVVNEDTKKRFDVDFYKGNGDRQTSHEEIIRGDKFSDIVSQATKVAKSKGMNYVEFYYKDSFIGSVDKRNGYEFKKGRDSEKSPLSINEAKYDIGMARKGNGITVYNRAEEEKGDYKNIAHISDNGVVKYYDKKLPNDVKKKIEAEAQKMKESINEGTKMIKLKNLLNESFGMGELPSSKLMKMKVPAKQVLKEKGEISGLLNRLDKNKPLKVGDITTIKSGKYAGKKVKIVADLGGGSYGLEFVR